MACAHVLGDIGEHLARTRPAVRHETSYCPLFFLAEGNPRHVREGRPIVVENPAGQTTLVEQPLNLMGIGSNGKKRRLAQQAQGDTVKAPGYHPR